MPWAPRPSPAAEGREGQHVRLVATEVLESNPPADVRPAATLLRGDALGAVSGLRALTSQHPASAFVWNDLAVALAAEAKGDILLISSALAATERAIELDGTLPEPRFNRAALLESLSLRETAISAFDDYLRHDARSEWAVEARERRETLKRRTSNGTDWRKQLPLLAKAASENDQAFIASTVTRFPEQARRWCETEFLGDWGAAVAAGDEAQAAQQLSFARAVANTLLRKHGEALVADAVAVIDASTDTERAVLARAQTAYRDGRRLYGERRLEDGVRLMREAAAQFEALRSPMAHVAKYYLANAAIDRGDRDLAIALALELERTAPPRYRALHASREWLRGVLFGFDGLFEHSLRALLNAAATFEALGEEDNAAETRDRAAALLTILGRVGEAWEMRRQTLPAAASSGNPHRLQSALFSAATTALQERQWDAAHVLLDLLTSVKGGNPRMRAEAMVWSALAASRAGFERAAQNALAAAHQSSTDLAGPDLADVENELRLVEAMLIPERDRSRAVALLDTHIAEAKRRGRTTRLESVLVERARLMPREDAIRNLREAIELIESRGSSLRSRDLRDSFLGSSGDAYTALADQLDRRGDVFGAIATLDRKRAGTLAADFTSRIVPGTALLTYAAFDDRFVIYASTRKGTARFAVPVNNAALVRQVTSFHDAIVTNRLSATRDLGKDLHRILIVPASSVLAGMDSLVFVVDDALQDVPFAALIGADGSYLAEHFSVTIAPTLAHASTPSDGSRSAGSLLVIGNPQIDQNRFPGLPSLRGAEEEARQVATLYPSAVVLLQENATRANVDREIRNAGVLHVAAHAVVDPVEPRRSRILLAGEDSLATSDVSSASLEALDTVVLAGCRTAVSGRGYGNVRSLAAGFVAAGARSVVATLWEIDDNATRELVVAFHRALRNRQAPLALREAQLAMLHSGDPSLAAPRNWAALQLYGR
jgi:CHAT domain-containing protein